MNGDHHVIFKSQGGTDHPANKIHLTPEDHYLIHHGIDSEKKQDLLKRCYDYIRPNIDLCWKGKIKPKIVRLIENGYL